jgi:cell wall-associated NlpC family hydrolase
MRHGSPRPEPAHRPPGRGRRDRRRRRAAAAAGALGRLGAGALIAPVLVLGGADPAGPGPAGARPARLHPFDRWDAASLRWLAPVVGRPPAPPAAPSPSPSEAASARRTAIVRRMFLAGDRIARLPYKWGGGHGSFADSGYDCSGSVSYVLHAAGLLRTPEASGALAAYGAPGPGHRVTVYANAEHVLVTVDGRRFDTIALEETGSRWSPKLGALSGYVARHPAGL